MLATSVAHQTLQAKRAEFPADEDLLYLPPADDVRRMSLGYREAMADVVWIRTVVFAGSEIVGEHVSWIGDYLKVINNLAPTFRQPYAWGGKITIYSGGAPGRQNIELAESILETGLTKFPEDHDMLFSLGMIMRIERSQASGFTPEEIEAGKQESVALIRKAAAFGAPALVRQLAVSFLDESAEVELQISYLEDQLLTSENERHKRYLRQRLEALGVPDSYERTLSLQREFTSERVAQFPYLREHEYALLRDEGATVPESDPTSER